MRVDHQRIARPIADGRLRAYPGLGFVRELVLGSGTSECTDLAASPSNKVPDWADAVDEERRPSHVSLRRLLNYSINVHREFLLDDREATLASDVYITYL